MTNEQLDFGDELVEEVSGLPALREGELETASEVIDAVVEDSTDALRLLERFEAALKKCSLVAGKTARDARRGFEAGMDAFLRGGE